MAARINPDGPTDLGRFEVMVNGRPVSPEYTSQPKALARARQEARTHRLVHLSRVFATRPPKILFTWSDGVETEH